MGGLVFQCRPHVSGCLEMIDLDLHSQKPRGCSGPRLLGGIVGALALATIGGINLYSMHRYGKTGPAILARRIGHATGFVGPVGSAFLTGLICGLGFDTASQIAVLTVRL